MSNNRNEAQSQPVPPSLRVFHLIGSFVGLIIFIIFGFRVGMEFGTYGGRLLADNLVPNDIAYTTIKGFVMSVGTVLGIFLAVLCTISFFLVIFAIAGDMIGRLIGVIFKPKRSEGNDCNP